MGIKNRAMELLSIANRIAKEQGFDMQELIKDKETSKITNIWGQATKEFDNKYKVSKTIE